MLRLILALLILPLVATASLSFLPLHTPDDIPRINWNGARSDWLNVKTDIKPAAIGDGKADDTDALLAGMQKIRNTKDGRKKVLYLPPGVYRITRTLRFDCHGFAMIGHGRDTRILWDGPKDQPMYWSDGVNYSRYEGMVWDGAGIKGVIGHLHNSGHCFETRITYKNVAFKNLAVGLLTRYPRHYATAESWYENCLFENCGIGISLNTFNDYDHGVHACLFRNCDYGIKVFRGNTYVYDSWFENSAKADLDLDCEHGTSVRRCTSLRSRMFIDHKGIGELVVDNCQVSGWKSLEGAIITRRRPGSESNIVSPVLVFDTVFTNPPNRDAPIRVKPAKRQRHIIISNVQARKCERPVLLCRNASMTRIPAGNRVGALASSQHCFFSGKTINKGKVFDARKFGMGQKGGNDATALQKTIDAARACGNGAIAYIPAGFYTLNHPITITGGNYSVGGTIAYHTWLRWGGGKTNGNTVIQIKKPGKLKLQNFHVETGTKLAPEIAAIRQENGGPHSFVRYEGIYVPGKYWKETRRPRGFECLNLAPGAKVLIEHMDGELHFTNCAAGTILATRSDDGQMLVDGTGKDRSGFLGFLFRLCTINSDYAVRVMNGHSLAISDFYHEQGEKHLLVSGAGPVPGVVVIQGPKLHGSTNPAILVDHYRGIVCYGPQQWYGAKQAIEFQQQGDNPVDIILLGNMLWATKKPIFHIQGAHARLTNIENIWMKNSITDAGLQAAATALDRLRRLGKIDIDLSFNQP